MKIAGSDVSMTSAHKLETRASTRKASLEVRSQDGAKTKNTIAAIYSSSGGSMVEAMEEYRAGKPARREEAEAAPAKPLTREERKARMTEELTLGMQPCAFNYQIDDASELKIKLLNRLLEALGGKSRIEPVRIGGEDGLDLRGSAARTAGAWSRMFGVSAFSFSSSVSASFSVSASAEGATSSGGTLWRRINALSTERTEEEYAAFASKGRAVTEDGRSIDFNVEFAMSRSFTERFDALTAESFILTDPLVINLSGGAPSVGDVKFRFDLDGDGEEEEISSSSAGSGFLALDRDGNGRIDDGSELFGTQSGDGFADLAAFDGDGNGWIDENDDVYSKLRVWVREEDGTDRLLDLKEADVGAIYLGSADTEFSFKNAATNETNGVLRRTGVYLKESGGAGTVGHVDLRC